LKKLRSRGYTIIAVEQTSESQPLQQFVPEQQMKYGLVFGNEVHGISEETIALADAAIEIPQAGTKHSLNISVCIGVVAWEFFRNMRGEWYGVSGDASFSLSNFQRRRRHIIFGDHIRHFPFRHVLVPEIFKIFF